MTVPSILDNQDDLQNELAEQIAELVTIFIEDGLEVDDALTALNEASRRTQASHCEPLPTQKDVY